MSEKQMTLGELIRWLDGNDVPYEIDDAGKLTVKGNLKKRFRYWVGACKYTSLPDELICVEGDLWLEQTSITSLGNLASVGGWFDLRSTPITSLGNLTSVGGSLILQETSIVSLGNLTSVGGSLMLQETPIVSLGNLTSVGGWLDLKGTTITSLGRLASVGGWLNLKGTSITSLGNLTSVGGFLILQDASIPFLDDLPQVGGDLYLDQSQFQLLTREALQKVKGKIRDWGQVKNDWVILSPDELEAIIAENERRESLHNTRENQVDWDLYDR